MDAVLPISEAQGEWCSAVLRNTSVLRNTAVLRSAADAMRGESPARGTDILRDEAALLMRARAGDLVAFDVLLNRHRTRVLNFAFQLLRDREGAEDLAQDAFVRAFQHLGQFRGESQLLTWLYRVTLNEGRARLRRSARRHRCAPQHSLSEEEAQPLHATTPDTAQAALHKIAVERALDALSEPLRVALLLREMHGLSYEEVARVLDVPEGTVRSRLHEARRKFRLAWEDDAAGDL